jgi:hypothetical protein
VNNEIFTGNNHENNNFFHQEKVFLPHFISNNTVLEYETASEEELFSLIDIVQSFNKQRKQKSKLYFKVTNEINASCIEGKHKNSSSVDYALEHLDKIRSYEQIPQRKESEDD